METEEENIRNHPGDWMTPANPLENAIGRFWGLLETRTYMRTRFAFVDALTQVNTKASVDAQLQHCMDILRLNHSDNMGMRDQVPHLMLRVNKDQECYDFVKWWATCDPHGRRDWGDPDLPYFDTKNADVFEPVHYLCGEYPDLCHIIAVTLLKIKFLLDLRDLGEPPDDDDRSHVEYRSPIIASNQNAMAMEERSEKMENLVAQIKELYNTVKEANKYFWPSLRNPGTHLKAQPLEYSAGDKSEMQRALQYAYEAWIEVPGAKEYVEGLSS